MTALTFLIPIALLLGLLGLVAFLWSLRTGQYDDLEGAAYRAVFDDDPIEKDEIVSRKSSEVDSAYIVLDDSDYDTQQKGQDPLNKSFPKCC
ncbi:cbb3-type cytochrome oxidase assembly protein CcoS [Kiloniella sp. EL199]|uniref:cbb3-type cytochrome oxidase assembly protein CcoS n=1 Tax=Kiloniella sp. EL199 TaxID=2107581 RepID=UPI000EA2E8C8|nr:cbb3-type cytochrome oxidase assembly protein CcoS [Kiloniella sp. EL199]